MAVAYYTEFTGSDPELAQQITERINQHLGNKPPQGAIFHAEGPLGNDGWWTFNVWESENAAERFFSDILSPTLRSVNAPEGKRRMLTVAWESNSMMTDPRQP